MVEAGLPANGTRKTDSFVANVAERIVGRSQIATDQKRLGDVIKYRIGNVLWETMTNLEQAIGEKLRPLCEDAENVRRLVSHPGHLVGAVP